MVDVNIIHIEDNVGSVGNKQICVEPGNDTQTGHRMWAGKDSAGNTYKFLGKGKPSYIETLNISTFTTAGLLRTDASGDIYGDVNTLGELNTALGGTTIDESTDSRPADQHGLGNATYHSSTTLAGLNALVSDGTLDDSSDTRNPTQHGLGNSTYHSSTTVAGLNALISDGTLDTTSDPRPPDAHALGSASHTASTLATINTKISDADLPHNMSGSSAMGDAFEITQGAISGSTDKFSAENLGLTLLKTGDSITDSMGDTTATVSQNYFYINGNASDSIFRFNKRTGVLEQTLAGYNNRAICACDTGVFHLDGTIYTHFTELLSVVSTGSVTGDAITGAALNSASVGNGVAITTTSNVFHTITVPGYVSTNVRTLSEITEDVISIATDATYLYTLEYGTGTYVRKFNLSDGVHQASSANLAASAVLTGAISADDETYVNVAVKGKFYKLLKSNLTTALEDTTSFENMVGGFNGGTLYAGVDNGANLDFSIFHASGLGLKAPATVNMTVSKSVAYKATFDDGVYTAEDWSRTSDDMSSIKLLGRTPQIRVTTAAASTIELTDNNGLIVADNSSNAIVLDPDTAVLSANGFRVSILPTTPYATFAVTVAGAALNYDLKETIPVEVGSPTPKRAFRFIVYNLEIHPEDGTVDATTPE